MPPYIFIRNNGRYEKIPVDSIYYVEACRNYCKLHTSDGVRLALISMHMIQNVLPSDIFCRVQRSFIVSLPYVRAFDKRKVYIEGKEVPIGQEFRPNLLRMVTLVESSKLVPTRCTSRIAIV